MRVSAFCALSLSANTNGEPQVGKSLGTEIRWTNSVIVHFDVSTVLGLVKIMNFKSTFRYSDSRCHRTIVSA